MNLFIIIFMIQHLLNLVESHARLMDPIARSSCWRKFPGQCGTPNYEDNQMNCGGYATQWYQNGGKCTICGESYSSPIKQYNSSSIVVKEYTQGQAITAQVEITANHMGWFEFRLCSLDNTTVDVQSCLYQNVLRDRTGNTRFLVASNQQGIVNYELMLPLTLSCRHCVFQVILIT